MYPECQTIGPKGDSAENLGGGKSGRHRTGDSSTKERKAGSKKEEK